MMKQIKAMIFLGTPHRGDGPVKRLNRILETFGKPHDYVRELGKDSTFLKDLNEEFAQRHEELNLNLFSLYETVKTKVVHRRYVVSFRDLEMYVREADHLRLLIAKPE